MTESDNGRLTGGVTLAGRLIGIEAGSEYTDKKTGEKKMSAWKVLLLVGKTVQSIGFGQGDEGAKKCHAIAGGKAELSPLSVPVRVPFEGAEFSGYWSAL
jgi:hypothetical protein